MLRPCVRQGGRRGDLRDNPPVVATLINIEVSPLAGVDKLRHLPDAVRINHLLLELPVGMGDQQPEVVHDQFRLLEDSTVDPLQDHLLFVKGVAEDGQIGVVDVPGTRRVDSDQTSGYVKLVD